MPAIQLARLKIQVTDLLRYYDSPENFVQAYHDLLGFYADRTRRPGKSGKPKPLIQAYNVPGQVMRRIQSDITPLVLDDPEKAIVLADRLWEDSWYECRLLAIRILGLFPVEHPTLIVEHLQDWGSNCYEDALMEALLQDGAKRLREETPDALQTLIEDWLSKPDGSSRTLGLRALYGLIREPEFTNLPVSYRLLSPLIRESDSHLEADLLMVVRALGRRSPQETAYFLNQNLIAPHKSGLAGITRRSLDVFPQNLQDALRETLREQTRK